MDHALTRYGSILFDDPSIHSAAWACLEGGEPYRVQRTVDVPDDQILWSNVDPVVLQRDGLSARFRGADWLALPMSRQQKEDHWDFKQSIFSQFGLTHVEPSVRAFYAAKLFGRMMRLVRAFYPEVQAPHRYSLQHTLRNCRPKDVLGAMTSSTMRAVEMARTFGCAAELPPGMDRFRRTGALYPPRYDHAMALLDMPIPANGSAWRQLGKREIPTSMDDIPDWVLSHKPLLLQMTVDYVENPIAYQLLNPAGEARELGRRLWRTGEEAIAFATYGRIRINSALEADASVRPIDELPKTLRDLDPLLAKSSPSLALLFLAIQKSYMLSQVHFSDTKMGYKISPAEVFMRARDMLRCAQHAMALQHAGFTVVWYGTSSIQIAIPEELEDAKKTLFDAAITCGMMTAAGVMPPDGQEQLANASQDDNGLLRYVLLEGNPEKIFHLDDTLFENMMDTLHHQENTL